ncbi:hypothetical protein PSTG_02871 [Puccinia striiformis f. sp. tritici PST-78]|uniref:Uncharacterized protein n=1 Tax=Puccinia striiformis f. sp. tritici PST-78 TaxID=1165861 RepID=A0A0L0VWY1_9BASI|nr:hypothetical protein PSTG_02871 [Puccinia striiformis f. sp. tritici PST-78]
MNNRQKQGIALRIESIRVFEFDSKKAAAVFWFEYSNQFEYLLPGRRDGFPMAWRSSRAIGMRFRWPGEAPEPLGCDSDGLDELQAVGMALEHLQAVGMALEHLQADVESLVTKELIRDNQMLVSRDGGDILPNTETKVEYIYKELQSASVMERRQMSRGEFISHKPMLKPYEPTPAQTIPATNSSSQQLSNQMKDLARRFESYTTGRMAPPHQSYGPPPQRYTTAPPQNYQGSSSQNQPNPNRPSYYKAFTVFKWTTQHTIKTSKSCSG